MNPEIRKIPYGQAEFGTFRADNCYYVDKTRFIPLLEASPRYVFLVRPRRFGKSLWLSVLQYYYDINDRDRFEEMFKGTHIFDHPTDQRHSYLTMAFNFAGVNPDIRHVEESFEVNGRTVVRDFLLRYARFFTDSEQEEILSLGRTEHRLRELFIQTARKGLRLYLFIDEYDNFANTILSTSGRGDYERLTRGQGFFRFFFNLLKTATSEKGSGLDRLFVTGVSPVTMDDVTSGMNIGENLSMDAAFSELPGFSQSELEDMLVHYTRDLKTGKTLREYLDIMTTWYDRYRFSEDAENSVFNPDMVLYFIKEIRKPTKRDLPRDLIDQNIRMDYTKLRHLMLTDRKLNGNFSELRKIIETGETQCRLQVSFPLESLLDPDNFISLLYHFGLLTITDTRGGYQLLRIPNMTVQKLMYGYVRDAYRDTDIFRIDLREFGMRMHEMAYNGEWRPVFQFIDREIREQTSVRNYLDGERAIQMFLLAYLNISDYYICQTEREMGKGYSDIFLEPFLARFPDMQYGYLIEMKYIGRGECSETLKQEKIAAAEGQLRKYADDENLKRITAGYTLRRLILVYRGWELVCDAEVEP